MTNPTLSLRKFFFDLVKPNKKYVIAIFCIGLYWAINNTLTPYVLKLIINKVVAFQGDKSAIIVSVMPYVMLYIVLWISFTVDMRLLDWVKLKLFPNIRRDIINSMFSYLNQHSHRYFQNNFSGSLANKITDMMSGVITIFTTLDDSFAQFFGILIALISMILVSPIFAVFLLLWVLVFLGITTIYFGSIRELSNIFAEAKTTVMGKLVDSITNVTNVRLFARHAYENTLVRDAVQDTVDKDRAMQRTILKMRIFWDISIIMLVAGNLYFLVTLYSKNEITIGDFTFISSLSISIFYNLWFVAGQFVTFSEELGRCKQALSIISAPHDIVDQLDAKALIVSEGRIEFDEVTFHYAEGARLFENKNVMIEPGQKVGLVGLSGSGKSTFVNLILRLFDVESGSILIDRQNIKEVTQSSLHEQIAMIPQDISLFHRTLMENIRYGCIEATDDDVIEASKKAHCHEFISQLTEGYQSLVGERGIKLSGGQRQRIAIARAILKNAPILMLDEATSALDSLTEDLIQDSLHTLMAGRTTIVIAHRLSTLSKMDRILVFENGKIVEDGSHDILIKTQGHYHRMWVMQAGGFLPDKL